MRTFGKNGLNQNKLQPQFPNNKRAIKRFVFSNSSKVLPKQHAHEQFSQIIDNKKIYQSMIKEQLRKLQQMETCVSDPEIQAFSWGLQKNYAHKNKLKQQSDNAQKKVSKIDQSEIDAYLNQQVNKKYAKILAQTLRKTKYTIFLQYLILNFKSKQKAKAADYHHYLQTLKRSFATLKQKSNQIFNLDQIILLKQCNLRKYLLRRKFMKLKSEIVKLRLNDLCKIYRKTKQFRVKKFALRFMVNKIRNTVNAMDDSLNLQCKIRNDYFLALFGSFKLIKDITKRQQMLYNKRKLKSYKKFIINLKLNWQQKNYVNVLQRFNKQNQRLIQNCKINEIERILQAKKMPLSFKQRIMLQIKAQSLKLNQTKCKIQKKRLVHLLRQNLKVNQSKIHCKAIQNNKKRSVINKFKQQYQINNKFNRLRVLLLSKLFCNFVQNSQQDIKIRRSLTNCLSGSKQWLIKNKQIFKAQIRQNPQKKPVQKQSVLGKQFTHPLDRINQLGMLDKYSKFKINKELNIKKYFLRVVKQKLVESRKLKMVEFAIKTLVNHNTYKKVWSILNNKQEMHAIMKEIDEQIQEQSSQEQNKINQIVQDNKIRIATIKFIRRLKQISNFKANLQYLKKLKLSNAFQALLIKFKTEVGHKYHQIALNQKQCLVDNNRKYSYFGKLISRLIDNNKMGKKQKQSISKYSMTAPAPASASAGQQKNNNLNKLWQVLKNKKTKTAKNQFLQLLQANRKITKNSIKITEQYLKNRLNSLNNCRQIRNKKLQIKDKVNNLVCCRIGSALRFVRLFCQRQIDNKREIESKLDILEHWRNQNVCHWFLKQIFRFSMGFKKWQRSCQSKQQLQDYLFIKNRKYFYAQLRASMKRNSKNSKQFLAKQQYKDEQVVEDPSKRPEIESINRISAAEYFIQSPENRNPQLSPHTEQPPILHSSNNKQHNHQLRNYLQSSDSQQEHSPLKENSSLNNDSQMKHYSPSPIKNKRTTPQQTHIQQHELELDANMRDLDSSDASLDSNLNQSKMNEQLQQFIEQNIPNSQNISKNHKNGLQQNSFSSNPDQKYQQQANSFSPAPHNLNNTSEISAANNDISLQSQISQPDQLQYLRMRYQAKVLDKCFKNWKANRIPRQSASHPNYQQQQQQQQHQQASQQQWQQLMLIFTAMKQYTRNKRLVRKYLRQFQQLGQQYGQGNVGYYPATRHEFQQARQIVAQMGSIL